MVDFVRDFAGAERTFRVTLGTILDVEEALGKTGFGALYIRLAQHGYFINDVFHVLVQALHQGGEPIAEAKRLVTERIDAGGIAQLSSLALDLVVSAMEGVAAKEGGGSADPSSPINAGELFASFVKLGLTPKQVRDIDYKDFANLIRAANASGTAVDPPSEEEFNEMLREFEERNGK